MPENIHSRVLQIRVGALVEVIGNVLSRVCMVSDILAARSDRVLSEWSRTALVRQYTDLRDEINTLLMEKTVLYAKIDAEHSLGRITADNVIVIKELGALAGGAAEDTVSLIGTVTECMQAVDGSPFANSRLTTALVAVLDVVSKWR